MKLEIGQVITQIISFLIMLWVLKRYAWKPILSRMVARQESIKSQFDDIENQKKHLSKEIEDYNDKINALELQSQMKIREAVETGEQLALEIQQKARSQAKAMIEKAELDAQNEVRKAKVLLKNELVALTLATTEKVFQTELDEDKQKKIILNFVKKMGAD